MKSNSVAGVVLLLAMAMGCSSKDPVASQAVTPKPDAPLAPPVIPTPPVDEKKGDEPLDLTGSVRVSGPVISSVGMSGDNLGNGVLGRAARLSKDEGAPIARQSDRATYLGHECVTGDSENVSASSAYFLGLEPTVSRSKNQAEGLELDLEAHNNGDGSLESRIAALLEPPESATSVPYFVYEVLTGSANIKNVKFTDFGSHFVLNSREWKKNCGDGAVNSIRHVGRLFAFLRIDYKSKEQKEKYESLLDRSPQYSNMLITLKALRETPMVDSGVKVTVSMYQLGGDIQKLPFQSVSCTLENVKPCESAAKEILKYLDDPIDGFSAQFAAGAMPGAVSIPSSTGKVIDLGKNTLIVN